MARYFNTEGPCYPDEHYMVNLDPRIRQIQKLVDNRKYFSINRGRQYGKTTTLDRLSEQLRKSYSVFYISFEGLSEESYRSESAFCKIFSGLLFDAIAYGETDGIADSARDALENIRQSDTTAVNFPAISNLISNICKTADKPVVLLIDEVDQAGNQEIFLSFLGMLRNKYLKMRQRPTFHSVILAGVYDIRNLKLKIRSDKEHQKNSPWNIAAEFDVSMSFQSLEIQEMLTEYEQDRHTGMNTALIADLLYTYTSGYPYLVSRICKLIDEKIAGTPHFPNPSSAWTKEGFLEAVKILFYTKNPLFGSLINKLIDYPELKEIVQAILFKGYRISYNPENTVIDIASMFGFVKNEQGTLVIANRIFETCFYNYFLSEKEVGNQLFTEGNIDKNQFIKNGFLDMDLVLKKFMTHWNDLYSSADEKFIEENGRKFFLLYLKPIINGTGNYYIESRTRDNGRTDVIVDYRGVQYIIEIKIWRGNEYNKRGEAQLADYLDAYHVQKGYLLSFNFNKHKIPGAKEIICGDRVILEVVV